MFDNDDDFENYEQTANATLFWISMDPRHQPDEEKELVKDNVTKTYPYPFDLEDAKFKEWL